jgi:hypothetical protein
MRQDRRQCRRTALVCLLREERRAGELDGFGVRIGRQRAKGIRRAAAEQASRN